MAKRYQFTRTVVVDGTRFDAGSVVYETAIPPGYLESCVQVGHIVEYKPGDQAAAEFEKAMSGPDPRDEEIRRLREELAAAKGGQVQTPAPPDPPADPSDPPPPADPPKQPDPKKPGGKK